ncbi:MAG: GyrI-like domain-containing protein [Thermoanaerobaculia bacterium]
MLLLQLLLLVTGRTAMKTRKVFLILAVALACGVVFSAAAQEEAPADLTPAQMRKAAAAVDNAKPVKLYFVVQEFTGSFADVAGYVDTVQREAESQGLLKGSKAPTSVLILYEDPTGKDSFRMGVGYEFSSKQKTKAPLKDETWAENKVARADHRGPYRQLENVHREVEKRAREKDEGTTWPVVQRLLDDPRKVPPSEIDTQMLVPLTGGRQRRAKG